MWEIKFAIPYPLPESADHTPTVTRIDGLHGVSFEGENDFRMSDGNTPETLTRDHAFTIEIKAAAGK